jgi:hypothetical protein
MASWSLSRARVLAILLHVAMSLSTVSAPVPFGSLLRRAARQRERIIFPRMAPRPASSERF